MNLNEADKPKVTKLVVVYSGRFQPFHKGHYATYQKLCSKFGANNVYIGTSNDTSSAKSPFNFNEKKKIATTMFGVPSSHFIQVSNPYVPKEILAKFDDKTTQYIAAVGEKDADRLKGKYFKPYNGKSGYGYKEIGYVYAVPAEQNPISGTDVRNGLGNSDLKKAKDFFLKAYPKFDNDIFKMIKGKINEAGTGFPVGMAGSFKKLNVGNDEEDVNEDGMPGGIGTGLVLPGGYINGAPTGSSVANEAFEAFLNEYFDGIEQRLLNEDDTMGGGGDGNGNLTDSVLDDQLFRSAYLPGWDAFDLNGVNYADIVGYTMFGHDSESHIQKTGNVKIPVLNPKDENGPMTRVIHPSKGEDYAREKANSWEMYPFNQRQQNIFKTPDVEAGAGLKSNIVKEENLYDPIGNLIDKTFAEEIFQQFLAEYLEEEPNAALDRDITYTDTQGKQQKIKARSALRLPKDHPAHIQAAKIMGPDDAPANEPKKKEEPGKAATQAAKPAQPGQPVKKDQTAQGKVNKAVGTHPQSGDETEAPNPQKLSGGELKTNAEKTDKEKNAEHKAKFLDKIKHYGKKVKEEAEKLWDDFSTEEQHDAHEVNDAHSETRKNWKQRSVDFVKGIPHNIAKASYAIAKAKSHQLKNTGRAIQSLVVSASKGEKPKFGMYKDKNGKWQHSESEAKKQKKACVDTIKDVAMTAGAVITGGALGGVVGHIVGGHGAASVGSALVHGASNTLHHGVAGFAHHAAVDFAKHCGWESLGLATGASHSSAAAQAAGVGLAHSAVGEHLPKIASAALKAIGLHEADENNELKQNSDLFSNMLKDVLERLQDFEASPEQMLATMHSYSKVKEENQNKEKADSVSKLLKPINEEVQSKTESINEFVKWACGRLKLKEEPKVTILGKDYSTEASSLGGYSPQTKEIYAVGEGRMLADVLRTIAHELVHRKQDELGLIGSAEKDGKDGSPIENQAHAVAGILMREYGRKNKQIFNEDINVDVDKGDTILTGKFKNKKTTVKDISKDDKGMPTINGKQATTFRMTNEVGSNDWRFKAIMKMWDKAGSFTKKKIGVAVCKNPNASRNDIARELRSFGYRDITSAGDQLGLDEKKNINEAQAVSGGKVHKFITGKNLGFKGKKYSEIEFETLGIDNRNQTVRLKIIAPKEIGGNEMSLDFRTIRRGSFFKTDTSSHSIKETLNEGGAYGHMSHPFDDMDLTFGDLKNIIKGALTGNLELTREKTDGQALAISWKNGRLIAARNKGHLANAGANAMGIEDVASKFAGRGGLTDAYNFAMRDLTAAISGLSQKQREKIFNEGKCFMNLEVIWPTSVNVIPYGQPLLVFHNTTCYDEKGVAIGADQSAARILAGMIKQVNGDVQSKYTIQGPPITELPKNEDLSSKQNSYITKLQKLQFEFQLSDKDNVANYHQAWWDNFITKNAPKGIDKITQQSLVKRWAFGDKSFRLNTISNEEVQKWAIEHDKVNVAKQQKDNIRPFEEIFLGVGADVLSFMSSVLTANPDAAVRSMKEKLKSVAAQVRTAGNPAQIAKLKAELARLQNIGGKNKIVPNEGIVFVYKGNTYKLTGTFAPLNQILGIFYA